MSFYLRFSYWAQGQMPDLVYLLSEFHNIKGNVVGDNILVETYLSPAISWESNCWLVSTPHLGCFPILFYKSLIFTSFLLISPKIVSLGDADLFNILESVSIRFVCSIYVGCCLVKPSNCFSLESISTWQCRFNTHISECFWSFFEQKAKPQHATSRLDWSLVVFLILGSLSYIQWLCSKFITQINQK